MKNQDLAAAYQTTLVIWVALLASQVVFLILGFVSKPEFLSFDFRRSFAGENPLFTLAFAVAAVSLIIASLIVKRRYFAIALDQQQVGTLVSGMITALAMCEGASMLGLLLALAFDYAYFYLFIIAAAVGMLLHFPKRDDVFAIGYKDR